LCLKPVAVFLKRFAAPLLLFILGIFNTPHSVIDTLYCRKKQ
jgi:hypothetical protein